MIRHVTFGYLISMMSSCSFNMQSNFAGAQTDICSCTELNINYRYKHIGPRNKFNWENNTFNAAQPVHCKTVVALCNQEDVIQSDEVSTLRVDVTT